ncbi:MAG: hypothetical protein OXI89_02190, partial [Gemmatimonadota bacterium]|nr:hypothetical protein [Gemmatimonadota bacterium]
GSGRPGMAGAGEGAGGQPGANRGGGRPGGTGGGRMMAMDLDQMKERMFQNPEIKAAYDKQVEEDPSFAEDEERQRTFLIQQMRQMRAQSGGGPPR